MKKLLFLSLAIMSFSFVSTDPSFQKLKKEIKEINEKMEKHSAFTMKTEYKVFRSKTNSPIEESSSLAVKKGNNFYQKVGGFLTVQNSELRMIVDDSSQVILLTKPIQNQKKDQKSDLEKALQRADKITIQKDDANELFAELTFSKEKGMEVSSIDFKINKKKRIIETIVFNYLPKMEFSIDHKTPLPGRMEMVITSFEAEKVDPTVSFSTDKHIKKNKNGKWIPSEKYARYQLIDQTN